VHASRRSLRLAGRAADAGCKGSRVASVTVAIARRTGHRCAFLRGTGKLGKPVSCRHPTFIRARGGARFSLRLKKTRLPRGRYLALVRATDAAGNTGRSRSSRFRVR
jgi:hypothetical protein